MDLRMPPDTSLAPLISADHGDEPMLSPTLPTLLLFECVLAYMDPAASNALIRWFVDYFAPAPGGLLGGVVYEMFNLNDAFGRVMLNNLRVRCFVWRFPLVFCVFTSDLEFSTVAQPVAPWCRAIPRSCFVVASVPRSGLYDRTGGDAT